MTERPLGDLLEVVIDHRGKTPKKLGGTDFTEAGVPVVSAIHIKNGRINWEERLRFAPQWMFEKWMPVRLKKGDVLLTSEAPLGEVAQVETDEPLVLSQRLFALRGKPGLLDSTYLRYFLQSSEGQRRLLARASGTTVFGIRQAELVKVLVPVQPIDEQRRIAGVLGAFDDLIDSVRQERGRLVGLAQSVLQRSARLEKTFARVGDVADVLRGLSYKGSGLSDSGIPMVNMGSAENFGWLKRSGWKFYTGDFKPRHLAGARDLILVNTEQTWRQEILGWPLLVPSDVQEALFSHHTYRVSFKPGTEWMKLPLWAHLFTAEARSWIDGTVRGTTVANLPIDAVENLTFLVPGRLDPALKTAEALLELAWAGEREVERLEASRDELLPLLMSGRITVDEAWEAAS